MPAHLTNLVRAHSGLDEHGSLTSLFLLDQEKTSPVHSELAMGLEVHLRSLVDRTIEFTAKVSSGPSLDIAKIDRTPATYAPSVFRTMWATFMQVFTELQDQRAQENSRKELGVYTEPSEQFLLLDSKYFLNLLAHPGPLRPWEQVVFLSLCAHLISEELASTVRIDSNSFRKEFLAFLALSKSPAVALLKLKPLETAALSGLTEEFTRPFLEHLKRMGALKQFKEDYLDLAHPFTRGEVERLPRGSSPQARTVLQSSIEKILK